MLLPHIEHPDYFEQLCKYFVSAQFFAVGWSRRARTRSDSPAHGSRRDLSLVAALGGSLDGIHQNSLPENCRIFNLHAQQVFRRKHALHLNRALEVMGIFENITETSYPKNQDTKHQSRISLQRKRLLVRSLSFGIRTIRVAIAFTRDTQCANSSFFSRVT